MKYVRLLGVALVAAGAVGALMAPLADALPTLLVGTAEEGASTWTGKATSKTELLTETGPSYACESATTEGTVEAKQPLGLFHIHFKGCTEDGMISCSGEGEESGVFLWLGSWHLVYDTLRTGLTGSGVALLFLVSAFKFECVMSRVEVKGGMVLCLVLNPEALTKEFEFHCNKRSGSFGPEETKYDNQSGTQVSITPLEFRENGGTLKELLLTWSGRIAFPEDTLIMI
jgi:hypothetical protein